MSKFTGKDGKIPKYLLEKAKAHLKFFCLQRDKLIRNISNILAKNLFRLIRLNVLMLEQVFTTILIYVCDNECRKALLLINLFKMELLLGK